MGQATVPLSWRERLNLINSFVLPKYLSCFRALPLWISDTTLPRWQRQRKQFIWNKKRPRIQLEILRRPRTFGGLSSTDLKRYYTAAQLVNVMLILSKEGPETWSQIEQFYVHPFTLQEIFWKQRSYRPLQASLNPYLLSSLKIWDRY